MKLTIAQLTLAANRASRNIDQELAPHICRFCKIPESALRGYRILRRSIDARKKPDVKLLYRIEADIDDSQPLPPNTAPAQETPQLWTPEELPGLQGKTVLVIGAGPAGLFGALTIALAGGHPVVCDRGEPVEQREKDIRQFRATRQLNEESNYLFGEGGAGTWSDGKLFTRVNDPRIHFILQEFIRCGASPAIGYFSHPHIGSDRLPAVIRRLREKICSLGGEFLWGTQAAQLHIQRGRCSGIILKSGELLEADATLIACGHSARAFLLNLLRQGMAFSPKGFQLGMRVEHPQHFINAIQYGTADSYPALGAAEYNLVSRPPEKSGHSGVTSFCMCPGGEIIPAVSEANRLCTNGMSNAARNSPWANAAMITSLGSEAFSSIEEAYRFLDQLEEKAFAAGGSDYTCPAQTAEDFFHGRLSRHLPDGSFCFGLHPARLDQLLPRTIAETIRYAMGYFDKLHPGFLKYGTFLGIETRVSSPIRFLREEITRASSLPGLWFAGEGAGMAGGITSAAVDGIKMAEAICRKLS